MLSQAGPPARPPQAVFAQSVSQARGPRQSGPGGRGTVIQSFMVRVVVGPGPPGARAT